MRIAAQEGLCIERDPERASGYCGVVYSKATVKNSRQRPYIARISSAGKSRHLGSFPNAEAAALCYARAKRQALQTESDSVN